MPRKNRKFTIIPDSCYSSGLFKITPECLFFKLLSLAKKNGYCNASDQWLSKTFNAPIRTIQSQLNKLEKMGLIKRSSKLKKLDVKERKIYIKKLILVENRNGYFKTNLHTSMKLLTTPI